MKILLAKILPLISVAAFCVSLAPASAEDVLSTFDSEKAFDGRYAAWQAAKPSLAATNWSIVATGFGGAFKNLSPQLDASSNAVIELTVTIESADTPPVKVTAGPLVVLADEDGSQSMWAWYGLGAGRHVLTKNLASPTASKVEGATPGLDLTKLSAFHLQVDPGTSKAAYKITLEKLRLLTAKEKADEK